jgi:hypothetical protein
VMFLTGHASAKNTQAQRPYDWNIREVPPICSFSKG